MKNKKVLGYWIVVGAMTVGLAVTALFKGESINPSATVRVLAVLLAGAVLLLFQSALAWAWRRFAQLAPARKSDRYSRDPAARVVSTENRDWELELAQELHTRYGWRWRYCLPWVLVSGDDRLVASQLPGLVRKQWCATDDVVLLWAPRSRSGLLDEAWMLKLRKLRRRKPVDAVALVFDERNDPSALARRSTSFASLFFAITRVLHFSAPVYLVADSGIEALEREVVEPVGCLLPRKYDNAAASSALLALSDNLAITGTRGIAEDRRFRYLAALSVQVEHRRKTLTDFLAALSASVNHSLEVRGLWLLPAAGGQVTTDPDAIGFPALWNEIGRSGIKSGGRPTGWHPSTLCATVVTILACVWIAGMVISAGANTRELLFAKTVVQGATIARDDHPGLHALLDLQHEIERFEYRATDGAPWYARFGLNRDAAILNGLWQAYAPASRRLLVSPTQQGLENALTTVAAMRTDVADPTTTQQALQGHKTLKAYLMMAEPQRADANLMEPEMTRNWLTHAALTLGERQDLALQFFPFFALHLPAHPDWAIQPRADLVNATRQTLLAITGVKNSTDTLYHSILDAAAGKYGDQSLATILAGTDATGLFRTSAKVPGIYTRQAFDGQIAQAIDDAAERQDVSTDWTLGVSPSVQPRVESAEVLRRELRQMYFDDYAQHWQSFANSIQWEPAGTLPAVAEQLRLFADARQSPLIALMKTLDYQGRAGENVESLSDTLVARAQNLIGKHDGKHEYAEQAEGEARALVPAAPLDAAFGPVLHLVSPTQAQGSAASNVSMSHYLDAVTTLRLKLEAMTNSGSMDDQAKQVAQSLFQGKNSDLSDTRNYAGLIAASLGEQWSGLGESLFLRPVDQAMQAVLQPAQASLNDAWRQSVAEPWARSFQGRYPFASSGDDASFPELVRFIRDQTGLIPEFITQQLAGALELHGDQWVPSSAGGQGIRFDPTFLHNLNVLQGIASHLLASGAAQYRFDLMPQPTGDVTETLLTIDGQQIKYFNQADHWQPFVWPGNDLLVTGTRLEWQTIQSGLNKSFERDGRWAFIRMLESARVEPLSDARFRLTWSATPGSPGTAPTSANAAVPTPASDTDSLLPGTPLASLPKTFTHPITYVMRTDAGKGPLELLALRGFTIPQRIFAPAPAPAAMKRAGPPPLPASAVAAARHAAVPLPHGTVPELE